MVSIGVNQNVPEKVGLSKGKLLVIEAFIVIEPESDPLMHFILNVPSSVVAAASSSAAVGSASVAAAAGSAVVVAVAAAAVAGAAAAPDAVASSSVRPTWTTMTERERVVQQEQTMMKSVSIPAPLLLWSLP